MNEFVQATINGIVIGGFYGSVALGFSLVWGVLGVINLAHGELVMVGAYITWVLHRNYGWEPFAAIVVVVPAMFVLGYVLQRLVINRVIDKPHLTALLVTFGLSIIISNAVKLRYTATPRAVAVSWSGSWALGDLRIPVTRFWVLVITAVVMFAVWAFLRFSRLGRGIRAAAQNREAARIVGVDIRWVYAFTFGLGAVLAGIAGVLASPVLPIFPTMGPALTLRSFAIVAIAGLGRIHGAILGGVLLGLVEQYVATYVPGYGTNLGIIASFAVLVIVLVLRPRGLFGGLQPAH